LLCHGSILLELGREESRRRLQNLVRAAQLPVLALELLEPLALIRREARPVPLVDLDAAHPLPHRLRCRSQLLGD
jgi:hypothetical protein